MVDQFERLNDAQWQKIAKALRAARGNLSRNTRDHVDGILFLMQYDLPWRQLDESFGKWNSVYMRFMRWAERGTLNHLVVVFKELGLTRRWNTNWVEYSRATGANLTPSLRAVISHQGVDQPGEPRKKKKSSKSVAQKPVADTPGSTSISETQSAPSKHIAKPSGQMILATLRARRERRKAFGIT